MSVVLTIHYSSERLTNSN